jgi:hypothetical protein
MASEDELYDLAMSGLTDPESRIKFLAYRLAVITREKEELEVRVSKIEKSFNMGAGILLILPVLGSIVGMMFAFGKTILKPWMD